MYEKRRTYFSSCALSVTTFPPHKFINVILIHNFSENKRIITNFHHFLYIFLVSLEIANVCVSLHSYEIGLSIQYHVTINN